MLVLYLETNFVAHPLARWAYFWGRFGTPPFSVVSEFVEGGVGSVPSFLCGFVCFVLFVSFLSLLMQYLIQQKKKKMNVMPFGLNIAPLVFQRSINKRKNKL